MRCRRWGVNRTPVKWRPLTQLQLRHRTRICRPQRQERRGTTSTYVSAYIDEIATALAALTITGEPNPLSTTANATDSDAPAGRLLLALEGN